MPKRKVKVPVANTQRIVAALMRVRQLHVPCGNLACPVEYTHCSGCNEAYPCKTVYAIEGTSPLKETITVYGDQQPEDGVEPTIITSEVKMPVSDEIDENKE